MSGEIIPVLQMVKQFQMLSDRSQYYFHQQSRLSVLYLRKLLQDIYHIVFKYWLVFLAIISLPQN